VPFNGGAPAAVAVLGNHVDALVLTSPTPAPYVLEGRLRALGVAGEARLPAFKDVPTYREMGFDVLSGSWVGFFAPAGTPDAIAVKLNAEINEIVQSHEVLAKLTQSGFNPMIRDLPRSEAYFRDEVVKWGAMVRAVGSPN
jgi:tripartite-type tricarboxylate transporter receptor subunit TctC